MSDRHPLVMGVVNVTPDSFSDGGRFLGADAAIAHARRLLAEGADILDIGGESTRPGAEPTPADVEIARILPVVQAIRADSRATISIASQAEVLMTSRYFFTFSLSSIFAGRFRRISQKPKIGMSALLKSCAIPLAICPMAPSLSRAIACS